MLTPRFVILLIGILCALWTIRSFDYLWLAISTILIGLGVGADRWLRNPHRNYKADPSLDDLDIRPMQVRIIGVDYAPEDLVAQTPFEARVLRRIPSSDRPDYWLAELSRPLSWKKDGQQKVISHLVVATRAAGTELKRGIKDCAFGIAYVLDQTLLNDEKLSFRKCTYVAIGIAEDITTA